MFIYSFFAVTKPQQQLLGVPGCVEFPQGQLEVETLGRKVCAFLILVETAKMLFKKVAPISTFINNVRESLSPYTH